MKFILLITILLAMQTASAQIKEKLDSILETSVLPEQPGIALFVQLNGKKIYLNSEGQADSKKNSKINQYTNFRMASVSKQFTAMSVLLLEKDDLISFNDPISTYFPNIPQSIASQINIRHLLTHSSGIVDYEEVMNPDQKEQLLDKDVLDLLEKENRTYFKPGTEFRYSNSGYALLALLVEKVSGKSFPEFIEDRIFKPLKMKKSLIYEPNEEISNRAMGFARNASGTIFPNDQSNTSAVQGDGGVYTSLNDYNKWINSLWNNKLINIQDAFNELNFSIKESTGSFYGPGWFYFNKENPAWFHTGSTSGFSTFSIVIPRTKSAIVYFSNLANNTEPFRKILEALKEEGFSEGDHIFELHKLTR